VTRIFSLSTYHLPLYERSRYPEQASDLTPDREALYDLHTGRRYTFAELNTRANRAANFLRERFNLQKGDRVSILAQNCLPFIDLLFGLGKIGAIFAPLNWRLTARELVYIVNDLQPKVLICGPEYVSVLEEMRGEIAVEHCISLEGAGIPGAADYADCWSRPKGPNRSARHSKRAMLTASCTHPGRRGCPKGPSCRIARCCGMPSTRSFRGV
jgi:acyl-CoA synthetase (AMP-forming)/AMP-acid ligase II